MSVYQTPHEKKSFRITTAIMLFLLILFAFVGLSYLVPPPESGIAVNFGTSNTGSGSIQTSVPQPIETPQPQTATPEKAETVQPEQAEEVLTQNQEESVTLPPKKEVQKKEVKVQPEKKTKPKPEVKPQPDAATTDALKNILNAGATKGENNSPSDGITGGTGDQGNPNGDKNVKNYYGNSSSGNGGNYQLGGRGALTKPKPDYLCNEEGIVVVRVDVDKSGKVVYALAGVRGTTNNAPCLLEQAKIAALKTKWEAKSDAPAQQTGQIIYQFSLKN